MKTRCSSVSPSLVPTYVSDPAGSTMSTLDVITCAFCLFFDPFSLMFSGLIPIIISFGNFNFLFRSEATAPFANLMLIYNYLFFLVCA